MSMKNSIYTIRNGTRDLPACSAMSRPTICATAWPNTTTTTTTTNNNNNNNKNNKKQQQQQQQQP